MIKNIAKFIGLICIGIISGIICSYMAMEKTKKQWTTIERKIIVSKYQLKTIERANEIAAAIELLEKLGLYNSDEERCFHLGYIEELENDYLLKSLVIRILNREKSLK